MNISKKVSLAVNGGFFPHLPLTMVSVRGTEGEFDTNNIVTVGRITQLSSNPPTLCIALKESRFSYTQIKQSGEFVVNFVDKPLLFASDFCGVKSRRSIDKFAARYGVASFPTGETPWGLGGGARRPSVRLPLPNPLPPQRPLPNGLLNNQSWGIITSITM